MFMFVVFGNLFYFTFKILFIPDWCASAAVVDLRLACYYLSLRRWTDNDSNTEHESLKNKAFKIIKWKIDKFCWKPVTIVTFPRRKFTKTIIKIWKLIKTNFKKYLLVHLDESDHSEKALLKSRFYTGKCKDYVTNGIVYSQLERL